MLGLNNHEDRPSRAELTEDPLKSQWLNPLKVYQSERAAVITSGTCGRHGPHSRGRESWRVSKGAGGGGVSLLPASVPLAGARSHDRPALLGGSRKMRMTQGLVFT